MAGQNCVIPTVLAGIREEVLRKVTVNSRSFQRLSQCMRGRNLARQPLDFEELDLNKDAFFVMHIS